MTGLELWPEWTRLAACRGASKEACESAFGTADEQRAFIAEFCRHCPVKQECGDYGRDEPGVFGGVTQRGRSVLLGAPRAARRRAAA